MEQFNLEKYLENPSRKIVTRSGHNVRILCTDQRGNMPIVALVEFETLDGVQLFYHDGKNESHREYDLFFADEEELSEFDKCLLSAFYSVAGKAVMTIGPASFQEDVDEWSKPLLDLARKEILKDFPKWKKATEYKEFEVHVCVMDKDMCMDEDTYTYLDTTVIEGEYYIELSDLKTLPKEE